MFLTCLLAAVREEEGRRRAEVLSRYDARQEVRLPPEAGLLEFCFPVGVELVKRQEFLKPEAHRFLLTTGDGTQVHGFCRTFLAPPPAPGAPLPRFPLVLCLLSPHPWAPVFFPLLALVERAACGAGRALRTPSVALGSDAARLLAAAAVAGATALAEVGLDSNGRTSGAASASRGDPPAPPAPHSDVSREHLRAQSRAASALDGRLLQVGSVSLHLPSPAVGPGAAAASAPPSRLLWCVPPDALADAFAALLLERRVIVIAADPGAAAGGAMALAAALEPLSWRGALLPLLPARLARHAAAPVPVLAGIPAAAAASALGWRAGGARRAAPPGARHAPLGDVGRDDDPEDPLAGALVLDLDAPLGGSAVPSTLVGASAGAGGGDTAAGREARARLRVLGPPAPSREALAAALARVRGRMRSPDDDEAAAGARTVFLEYLCRLVGDYREHLRPDGTGAGRARAGGAQGGEGGHGDEGDLAREIGPVPGTAVLSTGAKVTGADGRPAAPAGAIRSAGWLFDLRAWASEPSPGRRRGPFLRALAETHSAAEFFAERCAAAAAGTLPHLDELERRISGRRARLAEAVARADGGGPAGPGRPDGGDAAWRASAGPEAAARGTPPTTKPASGGFWRRVLPGGKGGAAGRDEAPGPPPQQGGRGPPPVPSPHAFADDDPDLGLGLAEALRRGASAAGRGDARGGTPLTASMRGDRAGSSGGGLRTPLTESPPAADPSPLGDSALSRGAVPPLAVPVAARQASARLPGYNPAAPPSARDFAQPQRAPPPPALPTAAAPRPAPPGAPPGGPLSASARRPAQLTRPLEESSAQPTWPLGEPSGARATPGGRESRASLDAVAAWLAKPQSQDAAWAGPLGNSPGLRASVGSLSQGSLSSSGRDVPSREASFDRERQARGTAAPIQETPRAASYTRRPANVPAPSRDGPLRTQASGGPLGGVLALSFSHSSARGAPAPGPTRPPPLGDGEAGRRGPLAVPASSLRAAPPPPDSAGPGGAPRTAAGVTPRPSPFSASPHSASSATAGPSAPPPLGGPLAPTLAPAGPTVGSLAAAALARRPSGGAPAPPAPQPTPARPWEPRASPSSRQGPATSDAPRAPGPRAAAPGVSAGPPVRPRGEPPRRAPGHQAALLQAPSSGGPLSAAASRAPSGGSYDGAASASSSSDPRRRAELDRLPLASSFSSASGAGPPELTAAGEALRRGRESLDASRRAREELASACQAQAEAARSHAARAVQEATSASWLPAGRGGAQRGEDAAPTPPDAPGPPPARMRGPPPDAPAPADRPWDASAPAARATSRTSAPSISLDGVPRAGSVSGSACSGDSFSSARSVALELGEVDLGPVTLAAEAAPPSPRLRDAAGPPALTPVAPPRRCTPDEVRSDSPPHGPSRGLLARGEPQDREAELSELRRFGRSLSLKLPSRAPEAAAGPPLLRAVSATGEPPPSLRAASATNEASFRAAQPEQGEREARPGAAKGHEAGAQAPSPPAPREPPSPPSSSPPPSPGSPSRPRALLPRALPRPEDIPAGTPAALVNPYLADILAQRRQDGLAVGDGGSLEQWLAEAAYPAAPLGDAVDEPGRISPVRPPAGPILEIIPADSHVGLERSPERLDSGSSEPSPAGRLAPGARAASSLIDPRNPFEDPTPPDSPASEGGVGTPFPPPGDAPALPGGGTPADLGGAAPPGTLGDPQPAAAPLRVPAGALGPSPPKHRALLSPIPTGRDPRALPTAAPSAGRGGRLGPRADDTADASSWLGAVPPLPELGATVVVRPGAGAVEEPPWAHSLLPTMEEILAGRYVAPRSRLEDD